MGNYSVYIHENKKNGKKYVGMTSQKPERRWGREGCQYQNNNNFSADIAKHGWDSFSHVIVASGLTFEQAMAMESALIKKYNTRDSLYGYNKYSGTYAEREECYKTISRSKIGHVVSDLTRRKIRQSVPSRPVMQVSLVDGSIVAVHSSLTSAAQAVGGFKTNIWAVCMGRKPTCKGYRWEYADVLEEAAKC